MRRRFLFLMAYWLTSPIAWRHRRALRNPEGAQNRVLARLVKSLRQTEYGASLAISKPAEFADKVPVVEFSDLAPWITRQKEGKAALLPQPPRFYERTSGSTGAPKDIPYSSGLLKSFGRMFVLWARDLYRGVPDLGQGRIYFSISPQLRSAESESQYGLQDDRDYLPRPVRWLLGDRFLSVPGAQNASTTGGFLDATSLALLGAEDLQVISVWSPSFLTVILDHIQSNTDRLAALLPAERGDAIKVALKQENPWPVIWPKLCLLSLWEDGQAGPMAKDLEERLPGVLVQGKGLLATEAPMTLPRVGAHGQEPLLTEVYFEFQDSEGELHGLHALQPDTEYSVIISTSGGLFRYRTHDCVRVVGRVGATPTLRFVGRKNKTSDLVGEKLSEAFVEQVLAGLELPGGRCVLAPDSEKTGYLLLLEQEPADRASLAEALDRALSSAHHYGLARDLGQIQPAQVRVMPNLSLRLMEGASGPDFGNAKISALLTAPLKSAFVQDLEDSREAK
jgi:hypothetical protein